MKRALVTGGSGVIGAALCRDLARQGLHVIVHAHRNIARAEAVAGEIRSAGGSAETASFDAADAGRSAQELERLLEAGPVQVLVHNAGITADAPLAGMSESQWTSVIGVSLNGFFYVAKPLLLPMIRTRWGRSSRCPRRRIMGNRGQANSRRQIRTARRREVARDRGPKPRGVTVNAVAPGIVASAMTKDAFSDDDINRLVPMKRAGTPEEVASVVGFLCSDEAAYVSGQVISVNGAMA